jgi:uncharacterized protein (TIGR02246 family)
MLRGMTIWTSLLLLALAGVARADVTSEIRAHEEAFARACEAGNVDAVVALYTDDAVIVWPGDGEEGRGKVEIAARAKRMCKDTRDLKLTIESLQVVPIDDTHVVAIGRWKNSFTGPAGAPRSVTLRATEVLVKRDGAWRYVVDHASIGMPPPGARPRPGMGARRERRTR